jgi:hypothetical protein
MHGDDAFPNLENPLATGEQREVEERALRLVKRPEFERARAVVAHRWRNAVAYPARDQMSRFDSMIDEYVFHHALWAANSDPRYPKITGVLAPPHHWFGRDVPGSRWGGESPDVIYRVVPIEHGGAYEIGGWASTANARMSVYSLMSDNTAQPVTQDLLDSADMVVNEDGEFLITIDATPAQGRPNHLHTEPGSDWLNIRDVLGDWMTQTPNALRVQRLDSADRPPLSDDELTERGVRRLVDGVFFAYYCSQSGSTMPPNEMQLPVSSALTSGLSNQLGTKANLRLDDDEALVITTTRGGALFRNAVLHDVFSMTLNYWSHTSSLNMTQMAPDSDGRFTLVVAHEDPGVHNWLDTCGLNEMIFGHRWQSFPHFDAGDAPTISARAVPFRDLDAVLPKGIARIDAAGRREQIARREAGFNRRVIDH